MAVASTAPATCSPYLLIPDIARVVEANLLPYESVAIHVRPDLLLLPPLPLLPLLHPLLAVAEKPLLLGRSVLVGIELHGVVELARWTVGDTGGSVT